MERKDYAEKFMEIKNEILKEIRKMLPFDSAHHFAEKFYVHYVEGEVYFIPFQSFKAFIQRFVTWKRQHSMTVMK